MTTDEVYLLFLCDPEDSFRWRVPIDAVIVDARTLLHRGVPQPRRRAHVRLTEFPRTPGELVPLSTLTFELDGGDLWPLIGDWCGVVDAVARLVRERRCDAVVLGLSGLARGLIANGPKTKVTVYTVDGIRDCDPNERQDQLDSIRNQMQPLLAGVRLWPGDDLVQPPTLPTVMPYRPLRGVDA